MRIVSLLPVATEIVYALGLDEQLAGVTFECNDPTRARAEKRVVVGGHPRQASGVTSGTSCAMNDRMWCVAACGFGLDGAAAQAELVARELPDASVWALDADAVIVRTGPRLVDGGQAMAAVLHPGAPPTSPYAGCCGSPRAIQWRHERSPASES